jgi:large subunit ribosomal protein L11
LTPGYITRKHVYEIAKIKQEDELWQEFDLKDICDVIIDEAYFMGVRVVDNLEPEELGKFLKERAEIVAKEKAEIQAAREAKLLRT